jgi:hypothetical protein
MKHTGSFFLFCSPPTQRSLLPPSPSPPPARRPSPFFGSGEARPLPFSDSIPCSGGWVGWRRAPSPPLLEICAPAVPLVGGLPASPLPSHPVRESRPLIRRAPFNLLWRPRLLQLRQGDPVPAGSGEHKVGAALPRNLRQWRISRRLL